MIELIDLAHAGELDAFVRQHPCCHFMQTSAWGRVKDDWSWYGILCRDQQRRIRGSMALLGRKLRGLHCCMLYAPRGPIFDPGDLVTFRQLIGAARELACRCNAWLLRIDPMISEKDAAFCEQIRSLGFLQNTATDYSLFQPRMCYVLDLRGIAPQALDQQYHRSTRYNLHLAERRDVTVTLGGEADLEDFYGLMCKTAANSGFQPLSREYYAHFFHELREFTRLYLARKDGVTIAAAMAVFLGNRAWYMYSASDPAARRDYPNELLQWHMQQDALAAGCDFFDFRGVEGYPVEGNPKLGLHRFKAGFSAEFHAYVGQLDDVLRPGIALLVRLYSRIRRKPKLRHRKEKAAAPVPADALQ
ncbi:MAG: peptidoglycan bridge formation glycyltransferase FemA/FemB family protein [Oscillospiraceae bacterium]|nr:peptidoglycan bridge formation glycyltransferase FemA/FemB family protein [Oscillospiraceae bacterium]